MSELLGIYSRRFTKQEVEKAKESGAEFLPCSSRSMWFKWSKDREKFEKTLKVKKDEILS